jgi:hypothetical protein
MHGARRAGDLQPGDLVMTVDSGLQPLRWIGRRLSPAGGRSRAVRFKAGAHGNDRDVIVAPQHRVVLRSAQADALFSAREVLVSAQDMVNGDTIVEERLSDLCFVHLLFDQHELIYAEGLKTESVYPGRDGHGALSEAGRAELTLLFPDLARLLDKHTYGPAARLVLRKFEADVLLAPS